MTYGVILPALLVAMTQERSRRPHVLSNCYVEETMGGGDDLANIHLGMIEERFKPENKATAKIGLTPVE